MAKVLVIGGGLTGMVAAKQLSANHAVQLVEAKESLGGMLFTDNVVAVDKRTGEGLRFRFDTGGHWLHYKGFEDVPNLFTGLVEHERNAFVYVNGAYGRFPIQAFYEDVFEEDDSKRISQELNAEDTNKSLSYREMLRRSYGETLFHTFFKPYNQKLFGTRDLDKIAIGKFELVRNVRVGDKSGYNDSFFYPDGRGIFSLIEDLFDPNVEYMVNSKVVHVDLDKKNVLLSSGRKLEYDILINTMPLKNLIYCTEGYEPLTVIADRLDGSSGVIINMGIVKNKEHEGKTWVYYPDDDLPFYRVGFYSEVDKSSAPEGYSSIYVEVSTIDLYTERVYDRVVDGLIKVGIIKSRKDIIVKREMILPWNYCYTNKDTEWAIDFLASKGVHSIGRYGSWHWSSMHTDIRQALDIAEVLSK